ncbi:MAG: L-threonylcarbamoyladenylate synthase, partial [Ilumatobacteraceae bacterium]
MSAGEVGTSIGRALEVLGNGGLVAIPTETVYGLAADASNDAAVRRVFSAKGRPADHPLIVHVAAAEQLPEWAATVPPAAALLADACWPGPLTLLVPKAAHVLRVVTGGRDTVGVRVPAHPITTELLTRFGGGLAAPSANRFGKVSPTTAQHVAADLGTAVDY